MRKTYWHLKQKRKGRKVTVIFSTILIIGLFFSAVVDRIYGKNPGLKYYRNYSSDEYMLQPQCKCILQDHRGIIYVANDGGVLEYDGVSWRAILLPNRAALSLAIDNSGTIYVGGVNELGCLAPDSRGQLEYISLLEHLDEDKRNFSSVWKTHATKAGIFFRSSKYLFRWQPGKKQMTIPLAADRDRNDKINGSFTCGGQYFVNRFSAGLMQWEKGSFKLIPGGETFAGVNTVFMIAPYDTAGKKLLIGTREKGFFIYDGKGVTSFDTEVDDYLKEKKVCFGIGLLHSPGDYAMATLRGGLAIIDKQGKLKHRFTKNFGLRDNNVKYVFEDLQGNLWAALSKGISKIEYASPLSIYDDVHFALPGMVYSVARQGKGLYAGTSVGLFHLAPDSDKFKPVPRMNSECWSLISIGDTLLAATSTGVFQVRNNIPGKIHGSTSYVMLQSRRNPNRIWVGTESSLVSLYRNSNREKKQWTEERKYEKVDQQPRTIVEDGGGNLWLGTMVPDFFRVIFAGGGHGGDYKIMRFDTSHNFLPGGVVQMGWAAGHVVFCTHRGLFRFDGEKNIFIPDETLGKNFSGSLEEVYRIVEDRNKSIWLHASGRNYRAGLKPDRSYDMDEKLLARIPLGAQVNAIYPDPLEENLTWFATHKGLITCDTHVKKDYSHEYSTIIRRVSVNGAPKFHNLSAPASPAKKMFKHSVPVFAYKDRNLRFEFAAPFFEGETRIEYSYFLEGYDNQWSYFSREAYKDFTNLDSRVHTFKVKAKNIYGQIGREALFKFKIEPPWYRVWWMYILYVLLLLLGVFLTVRWRSMRLQLEKQKLERVVKERAKEIHEKNRQLEKQTLLLIDQAEKLKELDHTKSRFFANISHEFRTPLTLIIGPLEHMLSGRLPGKTKEKLNLMHRNSHRLLSLINRLLDLSRIDSGKMKLQALPLDINSFLKGTLASFEHMAGQKKQALEFAAPAEQQPFTLYCDAEKMEDIFGNLLANALKFTPEGGKITVSVKPVNEKAEDFPRGYLEISVRDTGAGIPKEQLSHIFDRFYQVDSAKQQYKGSGIGLALTRELVELHRGKIDVTSALGENSGTEFILRFPLGKNHLKPGEIAESTGDKNVPPPGARSRPTMENDWEVEWPDEEASETDAKTRAHTVLVVEDNPDMRKFIRQSIESFYTVVEAEDGRQGIRKARDVMPDLVISDIMMPEVDGYELCETLKKDFKTSHVPVMLLTAKASEASVVHGLETGADDYITKPFNTAILITRIKNLIDLRRQLQEKIQRQMRLQPEEIKVSSIDQKFLKKLLEIIEKNLSDPELNVEALSERMDISRVTLNKKIQALSGETATEFIRSYRLKRAMQLLKENFGNILDVALEAGFSSPAYFTKCFKKKFHQLPSAFLGKET